LVISGLILVSLYIGLFIIGLGVGLLLIGLMLGLGTKVVFLEWVLVGRLWGAMTITLLFD
jgi:hypothetical protein